MTNHEQPSNTVIRHTHSSALNPEVATEDMCSQELDRLFKKDLAYLVDASFIVEEYEGKMRVVIGEQLYFNARKGADAAKHPTNGDFLKGTLLGAINLVGSTFGSDMPVRADGTRAYEVTFDSIADVARTINKLGELRDPERAMQAQKAWVEKASGRQGHTLG